MNLAHITHRPDQATQAERDWAKAKFMEWADEDKAAEEAEEGRNESDPLSTGSH